MKGKREGRWKGEGEREREETMVNGKGEEKWNGKGERGETGERKGGEEIEG